MSRRGNPVKLFGNRKNEAGKPLCRLCSAVVEKPRRQWCSQECVDRYLETSWNLLRGKLEKRDKGICVSCGCDTARLERILRHAQYDANKNWSRDITRTVSEIIKQMGFNASRSYWEADHIQEVIRGGQNRLENLQTLCVPCHKAKTRRMHGELKQERRARLGVMPLPFQDPQK
jgi:5-methylcytosine-specific restriction endonuclease McrA